MSRTLSFNKIKHGLAKLDTLGALEDDVVVGDVTVRLRTLTPKEHRLVLHYARDYMERYQQEAASNFGLEAAMDFFTVRKVEALAHAIVRLGDLDFRNIDYVETGEVDEDGYAIRVEKHVFVRDLITSMDLALVEALHRKYSDMLVLAEENAAKHIKFRNPEDELAVLEARRTELLRTLGREDAATAAPSPAPAPAPDPASAPATDAKSLREFAFRPVAQEEARREPARETPPQRFVRMEDPDKPYSDEELAYLEEQEALFQARIQPEVVYSDSDSRGEALARQQIAAQDALQKRRHMPLNQVPPQVFEQRPTPAPATTARPEAPRAEAVEMAEGLGPAEPVRLDRALPPPSPSAAPVTDPAPKGASNPNFQGVLPRPRT